MPELDGARVAVLVESQYIPEEIKVYQERFAALGADVDLVSRLWGNESLQFVSEVEVPGQVPQLLSVDIDVDKAHVQDYTAVIAAANYTSVRLRAFDPPTNTRGRPVDGIRDLAATPPAVRFFAAAMRDRNIVKGALCHGLWLLTPVPELLRARRVICHAVVLADILNAGAEYIPRSDTVAELTPAAGVVVDDDLVTGETYHEAAALVDAIAAQIVRRRTGEPEPGGKPG